jgi:predicted restriction endonuclease
MTARDELWARDVKHRDRGKCVVCGARRRVEAAHIVSRKYQKLRCSVDNGVTLCPSCHRQAHRASWFLRYIVYVVIDPQQRERLTNTALFHYGDAIREKEEWDVLFGDR